MADARPDGVFLGGVVGRGGDRVLRALRERVGPRMPIMATQQFLPIPDMLERVGAGSARLYVSATDVPPAARMSPAAHALRARLRSADVR